MHDHLPETGKKIWDVGCGYGTTAIFATLNGHRCWEVHWNSIMTISGAGLITGAISVISRVSALHMRTCSTGPLNPQSVDVIFVQDTLHHLEPIDPAWEILSRALKPGGKLIVSEENGDNPFIRGKNFATRGFNRVGEIYDERLDKMIPFGNENARSLKTWKKILGKANLRLIDRETRYIRFYPPFIYNQDNYNTIISREHSLGQKNRLLRDFLFFGINFTAESAD